MKMLLTKEVYLRNKATWKTKAANKDASALDTLAWLMLADKSIVEAFKPVTSKRTMKKLEPQAKHPHHKLDTAFRELRHLVAAAKETGIVILRRTWNPVTKKYEAVPGQSFEVTPEFVDEFLAKFTSFSDLLYPPAIPLPAIQEMSPPNLTSVTAAA